MQIGGGLHGRVYHTSVCIPYKRHLHTRNLHEESGKQNHKGTEYRKINLPNWVEFNMNFPMRFALRVCDLQLPFVCVCCVCCWFLPVFWFEIGKCIEMNVSFLFVPQWKQWYASQKLAAVETWDVPVG